ncbi:MAG: acyl-CoA dehydrogenase domain protein [Acidimicrobiales bacterium]|nr:acyl-CoA dehydrogenase domain protein [Acidimicrobiales bacterium]
MIDGDDLELFTRSLRHATARTTGPELDAAIDALGWHDARATDPRAAISLLFELQGGANATSSALDRVLLDALGLDGGLDGGVVLPALGRWSPPGDLAGDRLTVAGLGGATLAAADTAVVMVRSGGKDAAVVVPTASLSVHVVHGVDPALGLVEVTADGIVVAAEPEPVTEWPAAVALAQVAVGHELVGASRTMLELARAHALERVQFGRPISAFQAVRHRLADTLVAIEMAEAVLDAAWLDQSPQTAAMAKALAGRGARTAARHCQQVLAGIGFTTEHPLHLFIRRILVLDQLFGAARSLTAALGRDVLARGKLPALPPL